MQEEGESQDDEFHKEEYKDEEAYKEEETTTKEPEVEIIEETQHKNGEIHTNIDMKIAGSRYALRQRSKKKRCSSQPIAFSYPMKIAPILSSVLSFVHVITPNPIAPSFAHIATSPINILEDGKLYGSTMFNTSSPSFLWFYCPSILNL